MDVFCFIYNSLAKWSPIIREFKVTFIAVTNDKVVDLQYVTDRVTSDGVYMAVTELPVGVTNVVGKVTYDAVTVAVTEWVFVYKYNVLQLVVGDVALPKMSRCRVTKNINRAWYEWWNSYTWITKLHVRQRQ